MRYRLWIDDNALDEGMEAFRKPPVNETDWKIALTSRQAIEIIEQFGIPYFIEFDHDLGIMSNGQTDTVMYFLKWLVQYDIDCIKEIEGWNIHSQNPAGAKNIESYMSSWKKSING